MNKGNIRKKIDEINKILSDLCNELNKCTDYEMELNEIDSTNALSMTPQKQYLISVTTKEVYR